MTECYPLRVVLAYVTCALVWGTTWFAIRVCIGEGGYPTMEAAALRFAIATVLLVVMLAFTRIRGLPTSRAQWAWLSVAGVLDAVGYSLVYLGEERVPGGIAAVIFGIQPLILAIALWLTRMEPVRRSAVLGALVSIAGVAVIFLDRMDVSSHQAIGVVLVLGSVTASTAYSMVMKRHAEGVHPFVATAIFLGVTAIVLGAVVLVRGPAPFVWPPSIGPTLALLYLAVFGSIIAFGSYFWLLRRLSLMAMSTLVFLLPLISLAVDAMFERELRVGARAYLGVAIVMAGLAVNLLLERRRVLALRSAGTT
jgi:drug/metabolite transporter (DMT)-like permease